LSNGNKVYFYHNASDYPDDYFMEFDRKGEVKFYKNDVEALSYLVVIKTFTENCNNFPGYHLFGIRLNNDENMPLAGYVGFDTLLCGSRKTNLPLIYHFDDDFSYDNQHKFVKVN